MVLYVVDTCVWRDYIEDRKSNRDLGKAAREFFLKTMDGKNIIIYLDAVHMELLDSYSLSELECILTILKAMGALQIRTTGRLLAEEAKQISRDRRLPFVDCLLALTARNAGAIIVSQDRHFHKLSDIAPCFNP